MIRNLAYHFFLAACFWYEPHPPSQNVRSLPQVTHSLFCHIAVPPEIIKHPQNISIDEGDTIILECEALGFPVPQITWYLNGSSLISNGSVVEIIEARKSQHEGLYRCEAKNPAGIVTASAFVAVKGQNSEIIFFTMKSKNTAIAARAGLFKVRFS